MRPLRAALGYLAGSALILLSILVSINSAVGATDISEFVQLRFERTRRINSDCPAFNVSLRNRSQETIEISIIVVIEKIFPDSVTLENPDGMTEDGKPYYDYSQFMREGRLEPSRSTGFKTWIFKNPQRVRFRFYTRVVGEVANYSADVDLNNVITDENSGLKIAANHLIVAFKRGVPDQTAVELIEKYGLRVGGKITRLKIYQVIIPNTEELESARHLLESDPLVEGVSYNYLGSLSITEPNDPYFNSLDNPLLEQWHLKATRVPEAWDICKGYPSQSLAIAIVDTGVDSSLEDLDEKILHGYNLVDRSNNTEPSIIKNPTDADEILNNFHAYHGTEVASVAGAETNNGICIAGVAWKNKILPIKFGEYGPTLFSISAGIDEAIKRNVKIINVSAYTNLVDIAVGSIWQSMEQLIKDALNKEILIVAATCNSPSQVPPFGGIYPAEFAKRYENVISVAATDKYDKFSRGYGTEITVAAPGEVIPVFEWDCPNECCVGWDSGTSLAAPQVAGLAALIWSLDYQQDGDFDLSPGDVKEIIRATADPIPGHDFGRINAYRALLRAKGILLEHPWDETDLPHGTATLPVSTENCSPLFDFSTQSVSYDHSFGDFGFTYRSDHFMHYWMCQGDGAYLTYPVPATPKNNLEDYSTILSISQNNMWSTFEADNLLGTTFFIYTQEGNYAKAKVTSCSPDSITFNWVYQPDGSPNFPLNVDLTPLPDPRYPRPQNLRAIVGNDWVQLVWDSVEAEDLDYYLVYRGKEPDFSSLIPVKIVEKEYNTCSDSGYVLWPEPGGMKGESFYYMVASVFKNREQGISDIIYATPLPNVPPQAPESVTIDVLGPGEILWTVKANPQDKDAYFVNVYYSYSPEGEYYPRGGSGGQFNQELEITGQQSASDWAGKTVYLKFSVTDCAGLEGPLSEYYEVSFP